MRETFEKLQGIVVSVLDPLMETEMIPHSLKDRFAVVNILVNDLSVLVGSQVTNYSPPPSAGMERPASVVTDDRPGCRFAPCSLSWF